MLGFFCRLISSRSLEHNVQNILREANKGKDVNVTKSALSRLKVNQLRGLLDEVAADCRGTKAVLVDRILTLIQKEDEVDALRSVAGDLKDGVASRKDIQRLTRMLHKHEEPGPITQHDLNDVQMNTVRSPNLFEKVFQSPHEISKILVDARAEDVVLIDVHGQCAFTDHMVIGSGRSYQQVHMLAAAVLHEIKKRCKEVAPGVVPTIEGKDDPNPEWLAIDAGSIVVHIFLEGSRAEYDLESLWGDNNNITRVATPCRKTTVDDLQ